MKETRIVVDNREELLYLLYQAAELEQMVMLQYIFAALTLKQGTDEGITQEQLEAIKRWRAVLVGIAVEEMLHLSLANNLIASLGTSPTLSRPNFPQGSAYFPPGVEFALRPFGEAALQHFLYLERPEGTELEDAPGFLLTGVAREAVAPEQIVPTPQDFATVGHLYRGIAAGFSHLVDRMGGDQVFVGPPSAQVNPHSFEWPEMIAVTGLTTALQAVEVIVEQGEGARGHWENAHYGRFLKVRDEFMEWKRRDPDFEPARPVIPAVVRRAADSPPDQVVISDPTTAAVVDIFNVAYELLLQSLVRYFTHTDETDQQLRILAQVSLRLMSGVLRPLGSAITRLPVGPTHPGSTAGPSFEMFYQMGNYLPYRRAAWVLLAERLTLLSKRSLQLAPETRVSAELSKVSRTLGELAATLQQNT